MLTSRRVLFIFTYRITFCIITAINLCQINIIAYNEWSINYLGSVTPQTRHGNGNVRFRSQLHPVFILLDGTFAQISALFQVISYSYICVCVHWLCFWIYYIYIYLHVLDFVLIYHIICIIIPLYYFRHYFLYYIWNLGYLHMYSSGVQGVQPSYTPFMNIITEQLLSKTALQCQTRLAQKLRCHDVHKRATESWLRLERLYIIK